MPATLTSAKIGHQRLVYLDENRSSVLQPLFNASVVTTRMDGYEETGAGNAGPVSYTHLYTWLGGDGGCSFEY